MWVLTSPTMAFVLLVSSLFSEEGPGSTLLVLAASELGKVEKRDSLFCSTATLSLSSFPAVSPLPAALFALPLSVPTCSLSSTPSSTKLSSLMHVDAVGPVVLLLSPSCSTPAVLPFPAAHLALPLLVPTYALLSTPSSTKLSSTMPVDAVRPVALPALPRFTRFVFCHCCL
jgi:hypothetical protein